MLCASQQEWHIFKNPTNAHPHVQNSHQISFENCSIAVKESQSLTDFSPNKSA